MKPIPNILRKPNFSPTKILFCSTLDCEENKPKQDVFMTKMGFKSGIKLCAHITLQSTC